MLNRVTLVGRLTRDPELRVSQNNLAVTNFTLAVNRPFTNSNGERGADFINCVVFRKQAENVNQYLSKGSLAGVDGRLQSRSYENKQGQTVYVTEVVCDSVQFLEPKNSNKGSNQQDNYSADSYASAYGAPSVNNRQDRVSDFGGSETRGSQNSGYNNRNQQEDNPFANSDGPVDLSDDDLPF